MNGYELTRVMLPGTPADLGVVSLLEEKVNTAVGIVCNYYSGCPRSPL